MPDDDINRGNEMTANRLYFVQHGLAVSKADNPGRPLSAEGIKQTENIARQLLRSDVSISSIFHSGKLRAQQTGGIFADVLNVSSIGAADHLSPNDDTGLIKSELNIDQAMYVGHLPHLEKLVSDLVTGHESPAIIKFQNSAVICLQPQDDLYRIAWYLTPDLVIAD